MDTNSPDLSNNDRERSNKERQEERNGELNNWLAELKVPELRVGKPTIVARGLMESIGIYLNDKHIGNVFSKNLRFLKNEFLAEVSNFLKKEGVKLDSVAGVKAACAVRLGLDENTYEGMKRMGVAIIGNNLRLRDTDIGLESTSKNIDEQNARIEFSVTGHNLHLTIIEKGGRKIEYIFPQGGTAGMQRKES